MLNAGEGTPEGNQDFDTVAVITEALLAKFGSDARAVARRQVEDGDGATMNVWMEVLTRLTN